MTSEEWRSVPGWTYVEASSLGRVRTRDRSIQTADGRTRRLRGRVLTAGGYRAGGRRTVNLEQQPRLVARLVLAAFAGPAPPDRPLALHGPGGCTDDRPENLRWGTQSDNMHDRVQDGNHPATARERCPRKHPLAAPNLVAAHAELGHRVCLACARAAAWCQRHPDDDRQEVADRYYAALTAPVT